MNERMGVAGWGRRSAWAAVLVGNVAGCAQVLGEGGYGPAQDAAGLVEDPGVDGEVTEAAAPGDYADGDASRDEPLEGSVVRDAAGGTTESLDVNVSGESTTKRPVDASVPRAEAGVPSTASPPPGSVPGSCPPQCNGGCALRVCTITVTTSAAGGIDCPAALPCEVQCRGDKACRGVIHCAVGQPCLVTCNDSPTCVALPIAATASSLCVDCSSDGAHGGTCWVACQGPACSASCTN